MARATTGVEIVTVVAVVDTTLAPAGITVVSGEVLSATEVPGITSAGIEPEAKYKVVRPGAVD